MSSLPLVSINIITYNRAQMLKLCLDSISQQNFKDIEIIIIDDGSTDETYQTIENCKDYPIKYYKNEINKGIPFSRNKAAKLSKGEYICIIDSDDLITSNRIDNSLQAFREDKKLEIVCGFLKITGNNNYFNIEKKLIKSGKILTALFFENVIIHSTVMIKKSLLLAKLYNESLLVCEDYDLWVRAVTSINVKMLPYDFCIYTDHGDNISITKADLIKKNYYEIIFKNIYIKFFIDTTILSNAISNSNYFFSANNYILFFRVTLLRKINQDQSIDNFYFEQSFNYFLQKYKVDILHNFLKKSTSKISLFTFFKNFKSLRINYSFLNMLKILKVIIPTYFNIIK